MKGDATMEDILSVIESKAVEKRLIVNVLLQVVRLFALELSRILQKSQKYV